MAVSPEIYLISAILHTKNHVIPSIQGICADMFHAHADEYRWLEKYVKDHRKVPTTRTFLLKNPEFPIQKKTEDLEYWCEEVRKNHASITIKRGLQDIVESVRSDNPEEAIKKIKALGITAETRYRGYSLDSDIFTDWKDIYEEVERRKERRDKLGLAGIPTGFPTVDEHVGGVQPGWLVVVSARLGMGKTWSLIRMAVAASFSGLTVQYNALEQSRAEVAMRVHTFASSEYGREVFKNMDLAQGKNFSSGEYKRFLYEMSRKNIGKFHVADTSKGSIGVATMAAQIERNQPDALYLDYLTLAERDTPDWQGVAQLSKGLKTLASNNQIPIIAAAQINRNGNIRDIAGPEYLAESDAIGKDADLIIGMRKFCPDVLQMGITKNRHGLTTKWFVSFTPNTGEMEEITYDEALDRKAKCTEAEGAEQPTYIFTKRQKGSYEAMAAKRQNTKSVETADTAKKKPVVRPGTLARKRPGAKVSL